MRQNPTFPSALFVLMLAGLFISSPLFPQENPQAPEKTREELEKDKKMDEAKAKRAEEQKKKKSLSDKMKDFMTQMGADTKAGDYAAMEKTCEDALKEFPESPLWFYNLACAQAKQNKKELALKNLDTAVVLGFRDTDHIEKDTDLESIRDTAEFKALIEKAKELRSKINVSEAKNGIALVTQGNLAVDPQLKIFRAFFSLPEKAPDLSPIQAGKSDKAAEMINTWYKEGTASGNQGDFYDNRDGDHSNLSFRNYPQLTRIEYANDLQAQGMDKAMSAWIYFNGNVIGNASMAGHRSLPRLAQISAMISLQYIQYVNNHIYVYPEHTDHDPLVNDKGNKGRFDTFPANTPYCIISQGSSGSDRVFMDAVTRTLAAFQPEVKAFISKNNLMAPTVQMIFRSTLNTVSEPADYLTGKAHPTVFMKEDLNAEKMVIMAHEMKKEYVPPVIQLNAVEEDQPVAGKDYFDPHQNQVLFNTACAIARIMRSKNQAFRIVISAENSKDANGRELTFIWKVLRGDSDRISLKPQNGTGSAAEIIVPYHTRKPVPSRPEIESPRVDIGVFAYNGEYYSAPGFVTFFFLDHEIRGYDADGRILSIDYNSAKNNYVDAVISAKKNWKDVYEYAEDGTLLGWKRFRGELSQEFAPEGGLVQSRDTKGRPLSVKIVTYKFDINQQQTSSSLKQEETDDILYYWYENESAVSGKLITKEEYDKRKAEK